VTKEEFVRRFKVRLVELAGPKDRDGEDVARYADMTGPTYWETPWQRELGPEQCAEDDYCEWERD
jgi:hypothetical protein